MTDKTKEAIQGYFNPIMLTVIFALLGIIGYFSRAAYITLYSEVKQNNQLMMEITSKNAVQDYRLDDHDDALQRVGDDVRDLKFSLLQFKNDEREN